jgi:hypothetical protein
MVTELRGKASATGKNQDLHRHKVPHLIKNREISCFANRLLAPISRPNQLSKGRQRIILPSPKAGDQLRFRGLQVGQYP